MFHHQGIQYFRIFSTTNVAKKSFEPKPCRQSFPQLLRGTCFSSKHEEVQL